MKKTLGFIKSLIFLVLLISTDACRKIENSPVEQSYPYNVGNLSDAKSWATAHFERITLNEAFQKADFEWVRAKVTKYKSGFEEILVPIRAQQQNPSYLGIRKLVINKGFNGKYYAKVIELVPDKEYSAKKKKGQYNIKDFTGYILRWDLVTGFKAGVRVDGGIVIGSATLTVESVSDENFNKKNPGNKISIVVQPTSSPNPSTSYNFESYMNSLGYNNLYGSNFASNPCEYDPQCGNGDVEYLTQQYYIDLGVQTDFIVNFLATAIDVPLEDPTSTFNVDNAYAVNRDILIAVTDAAGGGDFSFDNNFYLQYNDPANRADPVFTAFLVKAIINAGGDVAAQIVISKMFDPNVHTWWDAVYAVEPAQTGVAVTEGFLPWRVPGGRWSRAAIAASAAVSAKVARAAWNNNTYTAEMMLSDFTLHFFSYMIGQGVGDLVAKFGLSNVAKKLVADGSVPYKTISRLLGGAGLQTINKSYSHTISTGEVLTLTATRKMEGWATNKIAVIGRSQEQRVVPFAQNLSNELGIPVATIDQWPGWSLNMTVEENRQWIRLLKEQGYTIYDIGIDSRFGTDLGPYYGMEIGEIFGN